MAGVNVNLIEAESDTSHAVELPRDVPMSRLIPALISRLERPITGPNGEPMSYRLQTGDGTVLRDSDTLASVGVQDGAGITLTAEMEAGSMETSFRVSSKLNFTSFIAEINLKFARKTRQ